MVPQCDDLQLGELCSLDQLVVVLVGQNSFHLLAGLLVLAGDDDRHPGRGGPLHVEADDSTGQPRSHYWSIGKSNRKTQLFSQLNLFLAQLALCIGKYFTIFQHNFIAISYRFHETFLRTEVELGINSATIISFTFVLLCFTYADLKCAIQLSMS